MANHLQGNGVGSLVGMYLQNSNSNTPSKNGLITMASSELSDSDEAGSSHSGSTETGTGARDSPVSTGRTPAAHTVNILGDNELDEFSIEAFESMEDLERHRNPRSDSQVPPESVEVEPAEFQKGPPLVTAPPSSDCKPEKRKSRNRTPPLVGRWGLAKATMEACLEDARQTLHAFPRFIECSDMEGAMGSGNRASDVLQVTLGSEIVVYFTCGNCGQGDLFFADWEQHRQTCDATAWTREQVNPCDLELDFNSLNNVLPTGCKLIVDESLVRESMDQALGIASVQLGNIPCLTEEDLEHVTLGASMTLHFECKRCDMQSIDLTEWYLHSSVDCRRRTCQKILAGTVFCNLKYSNPAKMPQKDNRKNIHPPKDSATKLAQKKRAHSALTSPSEPPIEPPKKKYECVFRNKGCAYSTNVYATVKKHEKDYCRWRRSAPQQEKRKNTHGAKPLGAKQHINPGELGIYAGVPIPAGTIIHARFNGGRKPGLPDHYPAIVTSCRPTGQLDVRFLRTNENDCDVKTVVARCHVKECRIQCCRFNLRAGDLRVGDQCSAPYLYQGEEVEGWPVERKCACVLMEFPDANENEIIVKYLYEANHLEYVNMDLVEFAPRMLEENLAGK